MNLGKTRAEIERLRISDEHIKTMKRLSMYKGSKAVRHYFKTYRKEK